MTGVLLSRYSCLVIPEGRPTIRLNTFSEAEPTPFHAVTTSCSRPNGLATRRVNQGLQVLPRSSSVFRMSLLTHVTT